MNLGSSYSGRLQLSQHRALDGDRRSRSGVTLELRKALDTNLDLRLGYRRDSAEEAMLSLGDYY
jgi:hypothetical protein